MIKPKAETYEFNDGRSQTILDFSRVNEAWLVWRQDPGSQGNVKIHPSYDEAKRDYDNRVDAIQMMEAHNAV